MLKAPILTASISIIEREFRCAFRHKQSIINPLLFFIITLTLFPLAVSPEAKILQTIAPGIMWVAALLATLLSLDRLFRSDYEDGSLEQLLLSPHPLSALVFAKVSAHWLLTGLPLIIISPLLGMMLNLTPHALSVLMISLFLGTPILSFIGAIGSALTVGLRGNGMLLSLLVLPLYIPVLIFGASAVSVALNGLPANGQLAILGALFALTITFTPFAIAASLRVGIST